MALLQASKLVKREDTALKITIETIMELLATSPSTPEVYDERMRANLLAATDGGDTSGEATAEEQAMLKAQAQELHLLEELESLPEDPGDKKGITVFHSDDNGIFLWAYQLQGFLKAAGEALRIASAGDKPEKTDDTAKKGKGTKWGAITKKLDRFVMVRPDKLYLYRLKDDTRVPVTEPDGICSRPLRAMTMRGERVSISHSQSISPGVRLDATIDILDGAPVTEAMIVEMLAYGERIGLLQWRNSGKGRFIAYIDAPADWTPSDKPK